MKVYKIKNELTGLFSMGGSAPRWSKQGKLWSSKRALSAHLTLIRTSRWSGGIKPEWTVIEYDLDEANATKKLAVQW